MHCSRAGRWRMMHCMKQDAEFRERRFLLPVVRGAVLLAFACALALAEEPSAAALPGSMHISCGWRRGSTSSIDRRAALSALPSDPQTEARLRRAS